jgi:peptidoglycan/LPS O-acetylase OafA/YrhL
MIRSIEGARGIAALLVALYHLNIGSNYFPVIRNGYLFVDLFFVLSGFVICSAYASSLRGAADIRYFMIRRFGRLFPLMAFSTIVFVLASNAIVFAKQIAIASGQAAVLNNPGALAYLVPDVAEIVSTLTLTHSLGLFDHLILNTPTWSISTEFYTYVLFAVVCMLFSGGARIAVLAILGIAGLIVSVWASVNIHNCMQEKGCLSLTYDFGFARCVHSFCLGALSYHSSRLLRVNATAVQITVLFALFMLLTLVDYVPIAAFAFPVAFAAGVISLARDSGPLADALKPRLFQELGQRSYSIYLLHMPLLLVFENIAKRASGIAANTAILVTYVVVLYVISGWTYRLIESPSRDWFNRLAGGVRPQGAAQGT